MSQCIDVVWEAKYAAGHSQRYPWDAVVSFVFGYAPKERPREEVRILEVGCGTGSNLWFAAREGFEVSGIDGSPTAIARARERFGSDGLKGELLVSEFGLLPFKNDSFDLAIDRGALTCVGYEDGKVAVAEVARVLRQRGFFLFNPYSKRHSSSLAGTLGADGRVENITKGTLVGVGGICFYERKEVVEALSAPWCIRALEHIERTDVLDEHCLVHAEWRVVAEKVERAHVTLRSARAADENRVFHWRNTRFVVSRSTSRRHVEHSDHKAWFAGSLASPDRLLLIVCVNDKDAGIVRFDRTARESAVISVYLDENMTGRGAGIAAILEGSAKAREAWLVKRIEAHVRSDNLLGHKAFRKAGYVRDLTADCPLGHTTYVLDVERVD